MKQHIVAINDKEAKVKTETSVEGLDVVSRFDTIDLAKTSDPLATLKADIKAGKFTLVGEGREKIKVGATVYECAWVNYKGSAEANGIKLEFEQKIWYASAVPITGFVKSEMKSTTGDVKMELTETGNKK